MATYHFFDLKNHYADFKLFQPYTLFEIPSSDMEISSLDYSPLGSLLFVGKANKSITGKLNGLVTKVKDI